MKYAFLAAILTVGAAPALAQGTTTPGSPAARVPTAQVITTCGDTFRDIDNDRSGELSPKEITEHRKRIPEDVASRSTIKRDDFMASCEKAAMAKK